MIGRRRLGLLALALLAPVACSDDHEPAAGEGRLEMDGVATVERADGERDRVDDSTDVGRGDRVILEEGVGRLQLAEGVRLELRAGVASADDSVLLMDSLPVLEAGDVLVTTPDETEIEAAGTVVRIREGAARLRRALGMGVASYDAAVTLDSAGQTRDVPALREMLVPALGRPPAAPRPLSYGETDPWDQRYLGGAIDLGRTLEAIAGRLTDNLVPGEGRTPGFFRQVLPGLDDEDDFGAELLEPTRAPGETLVGAAITELGAKGDFASRWGDVFEFRDDGAEWGLVALDQAVKSTPLIGTVEEAIGAAPLEFAAAPATDPTTPASPTEPGPSDDGGGSDPGGGADPPPSNPPTTAPPGSPAPTTPPVTVPPISVLEPVVEPAEPVVDLVTDLLDDVIGGLLGGPAGG